MTTLVTRAGKGSPLINNEMDQNLNNLNNFKVEKTSNTGSAELPVGTTAERDGTPQKGWTRYNSTLDILEYWNGTIWVADISSNNPVFTGTLTTDSIINISDPTGVIQVGGDDAVTFDATGIQAGSYKAGSIVDTDLTLSANSAPVKVALNAAGNAPIFACRAWVNFNGVGTVAIRASGNVSSITDNGTGDYTVNFTTAMPDANYSVALTSSNNVSTGSIFADTFFSSYATTSVRAITHLSTIGETQDVNVMNVAIFR